MKRYLKKPEKSMTGESTTPLNVSLKNQVACPFPRRRCVSQTFFSVFRAGFLEAVACYSAVATLCLGKAWPVNPLSSIASGICYKTADVGVVFVFTGFNWCANQSVANLVMKNRAGRKM